MMSKILPFTFALLLAGEVRSIPNVPGIALPTNTVNAPSSMAHESAANVQQTYPSAATNIQSPNSVYNNTSNNAMAAIMSYLYGLVMPALIAQQQTMQNTTAQSSSSYPMQYYQAAYPSTYQMNTPAAVMPQPHEPEVAVNERVLRAAPTENEEQTNAKTSDVPSENLEVIPLDLMKHLHKKHDNHHHKKFFGNEQKYERARAEQKETNNGTVSKIKLGKPITVEVPIACPKCGSKMKLIVGLTSAEIQNNDKDSGYSELRHHDDFCTCESNKPRYFCECAKFNMLPQICSICNKIKGYSDIDVTTKQLSLCTWSQQATPAPTPFVVFRRTSPISFRRSIFSTQPNQENYLDNVWQTPATTITQPAGQLGEYTPGTVSSEPSINKRYAIYPGNESPTFGYEQQRPSVFLPALYETESEPTCYCWRCRILRRL